MVTISFVYSQSKSGTILGTVTSSGYDMGCDDDGIVWLQYSPLLGETCCYDEVDGKYIKRENCDDVNFPCEQTIYTEEVCFDGWFYWYDNTTPSNGACGLVSANYGLNPNETTWVSFENSCDSYDPFVGHTNTATNLNGYFDDMNDYLTQNTNSEWVWGLNTPDLCWRYFSTISKEQCYGVWTLDYKGNEVTVVPRVNYKQCELTKKVCEYKVDNEIITETFFYDKKDSLLLDLPQYIIDCTGWDPVVVNKIFPDNESIIECLSSDCTFEGVTEIENPCPLRQYGPLCDYELDEDGNCNILNTDVYLDVDCNDVSWYYTINADGVEEYQLQNEYGSCDCTPIEVEPETCPEDAVSECGEITNHGVYLDNSNWDNAPSIHIPNGPIYTVEAELTDGTISTATGTSWWPLRDVLISLGYSTNVVCANWSQCTSPPDVPSYVPAPTLYEMFARGWFGESCGEQIIRIEIIEHEDPNWVGATKDLTIHEGPTEEIRVFYYCGKTYYQDCDGNAIEDPGCKPKVCSPEFEPVTNQEVSTACVDGFPVTVIVETTTNDTTGCAVIETEQVIIWDANDFEGVVGITSMVPDWEQLTFSQNKSGATTQTQATSDVANATGPNVGSGIAGSSSCGDTHVQSLIGGQGTSVFGEGLKRTATGLIIGEQYCLDFTQAISNQTNGCFNSGGWTFCLDDDLATSQQSVETIDAAQEANPTNVNLNWEQRQFCFVATATTHEISLTPYTTDNDYTCNNWLGRMAIDCVSLIQQASSNGEGGDKSCGLKVVTCITDINTGENYDPETTTIGPCGVGSEICFDTEISSDLVCVNLPNGSAYAWATIEVVSDCETGQTIGINNYFTDFEGNVYGEETTLSEDCEGEIITGVGCADGITYNILTIDGITTYYDLGGNAVPAPKQIEYFGPCIEPISVIKSCAEYFGNEVKGLLHIGEGGNYFTDFQGNILADANPFCCDDCIQVFGCRDGRLAVPAGSTVVMSNGDILDISGLRYSQIADLITATYGGTNATPSLVGPLGPNFSQCQGSSQHELQFYNLSISIVSISEFENFGTFGDCADATYLYNTCIDGEFKEIWSDGPRDPSYAVNNNDLCVCEDDCNDGSLWLLLSKCELVNNTLCDVAVPVGTVHVATGLVGTHPEGSDAGANIGNWNAYAVCSTTVPPISGNLHYWISGSINDFPTITSFEPVNSEPTCCE